MKYKYWSAYNGRYQFTKYESVASNAAYWSKKPYFRVNEEGIETEMPIPYKVDLCMTDTFHLHEAKGARNS